MPDNPVTIDSVTRTIIAATQNGLPVSKRPYHEIAEQLGLDPQLVMQRIQMMLDRGIIRRIGAVPNHYALGYRANGMSVWDIPDDKIGYFGAVIGNLDFVSHCYHRPRHQPDWPYNLFAMVHGRNREDTEEMVNQIANLLGKDNRKHEVLYSTRILKKTGLRLSVKQLWQP